MMRFAHDCLVKMNKLVQDLEVKLGPGTSSLAMRFGLHSGSGTLLYTIILSLHSAF